MCFIVTPVSKVLIHCAHKNTIWCEVLLHCEQSVNSSCTEKHYLVLSAATL